MEAAVSDIVGGDKAGIDIGGIGHGVVPGGTGEVNQISIRGGREPTAIVRIGGLQIGAERDAHMLRVGGIKTAEIIHAFVIAGHIEGVRASDAQILHREEAAMNGRAGNLGGGIADGAIPDVLHIVLEHADLISAGGDGMAVIIQAVPSGCIGAGCGIADLAPKIADKCAIRLENSGAGRGRFIQHEGERGALGKNGSGRQKKEERECQPSQSNQSILERACPPARPLVI